MLIGILNNRSRMMQGAYQYSLGVIDGLTKDKNHNYFVLNVDSGSKQYTSENVRTIVLPSEARSIIKVARRCAVFFNIPFPYGSYQTVKDLDLDLIVATPAASLVGIYVGLPQIVCIHDMMYRFYPDLPEFPLRERIRRNYVYRKSVRSAVFCVVDSMCGKEHVSKFLGLSEERIKIIPFTPAPYIYRYKDMSSRSVNDLLSSYDLPQDYLFYPAQFWRHKNHEGLLKALYLIKEGHGDSIPVVFAGSKRNNHHNVISLINSLGLEKQVQILGYVPDKTIVALYKAARALVFPSLFGPTNIPIAEAMVLGVPVICSGIFGMPEQVGDAGIMFDPLDPADIADKIYKVWQDKALRETLVERGYDRSASFAPEIYSEKWSRLVNEALEIID